MGVYFKCKHTHMRWNRTETIFHGPCRKLGFVSRRLAPTANRRNLFVPWTSWRYIRHTFSRLPPPPATTRTVCRLMALLLLLYTRTEGVVGSLLQNGMWNKTRLRIRSSSSIRGIFILNFMMIGQDVWPQADTDRSEEHSSKPLVWLLILKIRFRPKVRYQIMRRAVSTGHTPEKIEM